MKTGILKGGYGYWETDRYPIGGCFRRAPAVGLRVTVERTFTSYHGANAEGKTEEGARVAFNTSNVNFDSLESEQPQS